MNKNNSIEIRELLDEFNPKHIEETVRKNWNNNNLKIDKSKKKRMTFIEGPPTMNGDPHIGHVRGRIIKDCKNILNKTDFSPDPLLFDEDSRKLTFASADIEI